MTIRSNVPHISVCICTFKRPEWLGRLLAHIGSQITEGAFTYSTVVVDNDAAASARAVVSAASARGMELSYDVEPVQNIALTRNRALALSRGDFVAFMDDDEVPESDWLLRLFRACVAYGSDGVLGPVLPLFEVQPPHWVKKGGFFDRPTHPTGYELRWTETRTGNVLFKRELIVGLATPFLPEFGAGSEDVDFFRRMTSSGRRFVWCDEARVHETVPASRCTRRYLLKRALLRGSSFPKRRQHRFRSIATSILAVPSYAVALPVLLIFGQHVFLRYLIKLVDHTSRLFAFAGVPLALHRDI